ncbi:MAG: helix-turn-helix domain-containing protein [Nocardioidaceae bacterium]
MQQTGQQIREARKARGMTQPDLARASGASVGTVRNMERGLYGKPRADLLASVANVLDIDLEHPVDGDMIRAHMPAEVQVLLDVVGGWLSALPEDRRREEIDAITARIFPRCARLGSAAGVD